MSFPPAFALLIVVAFTVAVLYKISGHDHEWALSVLKFSCASEPMSPRAVVHSVLPKCVHAVLCP